MMILKSIHKLAKKLCRNEAGAIAVEFAMIAPALIVVLYGLLESGRYYTIQQALDYAAEEGARYASLNAAASSQEVIDYTLAKIVTIDTTNVTVTVTDTLDVATSLYFKDVMAEIPFTLFVYGDPEDTILTISAHAKYLQITTD